MPLSHVQPSCSLSQEEFSQAYDELRQIARRLMKSERYGHVLQATAVLHEAFIRLTTSAKGSLCERDHLIPAAVTAMQRVLIDWSRRENALRRGGKWIRVHDTQVLHCSEQTTYELLDLRDAIDRLEQHDDQLAMIARMRIFTCLTVEEISAIIGLPKRTIERRWNMAKACSPWNSMDVRLVPPTT